MNGFDKKIKEVAEMLGVEVKNLPENIQNIISIKKK